MKNKTENQQSAMLPYLSWNMKIIKLSWMDY